MQYKVVPRVDYAVNYRAILLMYDKFREFRSKNRKKYRHTGLLLPHKKQQCEGCDSNA